ncbi:MAG TPA: glycosyltransferase family 87 protein [Thermoanaerobaculia bacterium]|nr:glycosyltransferase family 87 protein [Thermoanaerobaculia bacterium]
MIGTKSTARIVLAGGFVVAATLRIGFLASLAPNWDTDAYAEVVRTLESGGTLYRDTPHYNYSPVWAFVLRVLARIAGEGGVPFHRVVGALLLLVDGATGWLVFRIARDVLGRSAESAAGSALLFFANPISVFVTGFHAQFDCLSIAFLLLAIWLEGRPSARRLGAAGALAGSLLVKHVTAFHPIVFARRRDGRGLPLFAALLPFAVFAASFLPYWGVRRSVFDRVLRYGSLSEDYGTAMLRRLPGVPPWAPTALFFAAALVGAFALRRLEPARASLLLFLVLLIFLPGIAEYYFVWPIALGSLFGGAGYAVFTLLVSAFFLGSPDGLGLELTHLPGWHGIWWGTVFWSMWELRKLKGSRFKVQGSSS